MIRRTSLKVLIPIFCITAFFSVACKTTQKPADTKTPDGYSTEISPRIAFLTYSIMHDSTSGVPRVNLVNRKFTEGRIKDPVLKSRNPAIDDLEYIVLDGEAQVLIRNFIPNPLRKDVEYVTPDGDLARQEIKLDSARFTIRLQLNPSARQIVLERYTGPDSKNIHLITTDLQ